MRIRSEVQRLPVAEMTRAIDKVVASYGVDFATVIDQFPQLPDVLDHVRNNMLSQGCSAEEADQAALGAALGFTAIVGPAIFKKA